MPLKSQPEAAAIKCAQIPISVVRVQSTCIRNVEQGTGVVQCRESPAIVMGLVHDVEPLQSQRQARAKPACLNALRCASFAVSCFAKCAGPGELLAAILAGERSVRALVNNDLVRQGERELLLAGYVS